jgi:hypothetical protein
MSLPTKISFVAPTTYNDGVTPLPNPDALTYTALIDTVNPPVKGYPLPAAETSAVPGAAMTATFAQLGFTPVPGSTYFAAATATDVAGTSTLSNVVSFLYALPPAAPTGFTVG